MRNLDEVNEYFGKDKYATEQTGAKILEAGDNYSKVMLTIDDRHKNARGFVMGGVFYTLADFAYAVATNSKDYAAVTVTASISFLKPPKGNELYAEATPVKDGRSILFYEVKVTDDLGNHVAQVSITGARV